MNDTGNVSRFRRSAQVFSLDQSSLGKLPFAPLPFTLDPNPPKLFNLFPRLLPACMSPIALASSSSTLVIGSLERGQEYQTLLASLEQESQTVDRYLVDRIVDGGASSFLFPVPASPADSALAFGLSPATALPPATYSAAYVVLPASHLAPLHPTFLSQLTSSLKPSSPVHFHLPSDFLPAALSSSLLLAGLQSSELSSPTVLTFTSPTPSTSTEGVRLLRRPKSKATKSAIWALSADSPAGASGTITPSSLLTENDLKRPVCILPGEAERATKRKVRPLLSFALSPRHLLTLLLDSVDEQRACKGCTCGLAELEAEEATTAPVVAFDLSSDVPDNLSFGISAPVAFVPHALSPPDRTTTDEG